MGGEGETNVQLFLTQPQKNKIAPTDVSLIEGCTLQSLKKDTRIHLIAGFKGRFTECL